MTIINNALSGALAAQVSLSAASQNIANLQTKGYTRQAALLTAVGPEAGKRSAGNGVVVSSLIRFSDAYKSQQLWRAASSLGAHSQSQPYLSQLERVMGDDASSLSGGIDKFFQSLNAVAGVDPTSSPLRQQVLTAAGLVSQRFNSINNVLNNQQLSVQQQRAAIVASSNADIANIAALNLKISHANATGDSISALVDARDLAIDNLASKMSLEVSDQPDGTRNVSLKTGQSLVIGGIAGQLDVTVNAAGTQVFNLTMANTKFPLDPAELGGQLGGLASYERDILLPLQQGVSDIAEQLATKVNGQLAQGYTMAGTTPGKPLFVFTPGISANLLQVTAGFQTDDLAFSKDGTPGDTGNLQKLVAIKGQPMGPLNGQMGPLSTVLLGDADTQLVGQLGIDSQQNQAALSTADTVRTQATEDWQSTSGVNQDEEAVNLVEYQKMYQANMKVISIANALFDSTLAMMG